MRVGVRVGAAIIIVVCVTMATFIKEKKTYHQSNGYPKRSGSDPDSLSMRLSIECGNKGTYIYSCTVPDPYPVFYFL